MKNLLLALAIGFTAMSCARYGEHEKEEVINDDIYEGIIYSSGFCGDVFDLKKINDNSIPENTRIYGIKLTNLPTNLSNNETATIRMTLSNLKEVNVVMCGGFLAYNYEAQVKKIVAIKK